MNSTATTALNTDITSDEVVITLDDLIPMWGEGDTRTEAIHDLVEALGELLTGLREHRGNMAPHLTDQLLFLERLEWEFKNRDDGSGLAFP